MMTHKLATSLNLLGQEATSHATEFDELSVSYTTKLERMLSSLEIDSLGSSARIDGKSLCGSFGRSARGEQSRVKCDSPSLRRVFRQIEVREKTARRNSMASPGIGLGVPICSTAGVGLQVVGAGQVRQRLEKRKVNEYLNLLPKIPASDRARKKRVLAHINRWIYKNSCSKTHYPQLALTKLRYTHSEVDALITGESGPVCMFVGLVSHAPFDEFESVEEPPTEDLTANHPCLHTISKAPTKASSALYSHPHAYGSEWWADNHREPAKVGTW
jgi:hypothetical protein